MIYRNPIIYLYKLILKKDDTMDLNKKELNPNCDGEDCGDLKVNKAP
jgi:hypothetical protein